jgi:hypothetical protein
MGRRRERDVPLVSSPAMLGRIVVLVVAAAAVLGGMQAAWAATPATPEQTAAIAPAVGFAPQCITASIADADRSWATARPTNTPGCPQADGTVVVHLQNGTWTQIAAGSDFGFCPIKGVPAAISQEFNLCRRVTASSYVLGSSSFAPNGQGFGTSKPRTVYNGGVPSGLVTSIRWRNWGSARATGFGKNSIYRPGGGYYSRKATIELRATRRGRCPGSDQPAYLRLEARVPSRPGGRLGRWFNWAGARTVC